MSYLSFYWAVLLFFKSGKDSVLGLFWFYEFWSLTQFYRDFRSFEKKYFNIVKDILNFLMKSIYNRYFWWIIWHLLSIALVKKNISEKRPEVEEKEAFMDKSFFSRWKINWNLKHNVLNIWNIIRWFTYDQLTQSKIFLILFVLQDCCWISDKCIFVYLDLEITNVSYFSFTMYLKTKSLVKDGKKIRKELRTFGLRCM